VETNALYYGDNLGILREFIPEASVDLVYLDPPFNSNRDYNLIFKDASGAKSDASILAFEDTWHWGPDASAKYDYLTNSARHEGRVPEAVSQVIAALRTGIKGSDMLAYLVEMAVRLVELRRVLKPTGSLYLHCDPTASHYLKVILDAIFGPENFFAEIVWKRWSAHGDAKRYGAVHDVILYFGKTPSAIFNKQFVQYDAEYLRDRFRFRDPDGRAWSEQNLSSPNPRPNLTYPYTASNGVTYLPHRNGWKVSTERMRQLDAEGRLHFPAKADGRLRLKVYLDEQPGAAVQDIWTDIYGVAGTAPERLGYPTQKPLALLERIIASSSNPGDLVLDPFCGCGTALVAAQKLDRKWVGIDITYLAIAVMKARLHDMFGIEAHIIGAPTEVAGAKLLAEQGLEGRYQFEHWALTLVDAHPAGGGEKKKGADSGIDGKITFTDVGGKLQTVIVSVKSGAVNRGMVSDLVGVMHREGAAMALFVTLEEPTGPMTSEAAGAGEFYSELSKKSYPRVQIISIRELLDGRKPQIPLLVMPTYQHAEKVEQESPGQEKLFG
jgi:site-specific DNA-methyltransferase (adenine-specific)